MEWSHEIRAWGWLIHKDLLREVRAHRVWPAMLLLGLVLVILIELQLHLPPAQKLRAVGGLFWLTVFFAGTLSLESSFGDEQHHGCWQALRLFPISPATIFAAKLCVNFLALCCLEGVLVPALGVFCEFPILARPGPLLLVAGLGNLGCAAVGTLLGAATSGVTRHRGQLALVLLPLIAPILLAAAEATQLLLAGEMGTAWWRWIQLLAVFATLFTIVGGLMFEFLIES